MSLSQALPLTTLVLCLSGPPAAQASAPSTTPAMKAMRDAYQKTGTPGAEHRKLASTAGTCDLSIKSWQTLGGEPTTDTGTATRKLILGDRVMVEDVSSQLMGQPCNGQGLHGFDNVTGKYRATWMDSMSTGLMVSDGSCDTALSCFFTGTFHDPVSRQPQTARMTTPCADKNTEVLEMNAPGPDGKEYRMTEIS